MSTLGREWAFNSSTQEGYETTLNLAGFELKTYRAEEI